MYFAVLTKWSFVQGAGDPIILSIVIFLQGWLFLFTQVFRCCNFIICVRLFAVGLGGVRIEIHQKLFFFLFVQRWLWSMIVIKQLNSSWLY